MKPDYRVPTHFAAPSDWSGAPASESIRRTWWLRATGCVGRIGIDGYALCRYCPIEIQLKEER